ncbi:MAG: tetratricopeptide repeat protein, partial [Verrucomicrobia bacterium]|nr:tetratricopeptide repeat protein [Verrucomicrobiota bacterium]
SEFYRGIALFNLNRQADAQQAFARFLRRYPKSTLRDEAQFRQAQSRYQQQAYADAVKDYAPVAAGASAFAEDAAFELALAQYKDGRLKEAATSFIDFAGRFPSSEKALQAGLYAGMFLYEAGDYAGAEARLRPLGASGKDEAAYWLGLSLLKLARAADAEAVFAALLKDHPGSARAGDARLGLGDALLAQDKRVEAAEALRGYADAEPTGAQAPRALYSASVALHRADRFDDADARCGEFLSRYATNALAPQVIFLSGENRFLGGKHGPAVTRYEELLARDDASKEDRARAHFRLAWIARDAGKFDAALDRLGKMQDNDAGDVIAAEARYLKGVCLAEAGRTGEAIAALEAYLNDAGDRRYGDDALLRLAAACAKESKWAIAADTYARFLKEYAGSELASQARYQMAECRYALKDYEPAAGDYAEVHKAQPQGPLAPFALFGLGLCRADQGRWAPAAEHFAAVAKEYAGAELAPQARYRQARCQMELKQWSEATEVLRELLKDAPRHDVARAAAVSLAYCLQEQKAWGEAAEAFGRAANDYPATNDTARLIYEQAWSWREAGRDAEARAAFGTLAERFPEDALAADANFHLAEASYAQATAPEVSAEKRQKLLVEARERFERILKIKDAARLEDKAYYRIGWTLWLAEDFAPAAKAFDQVQEKNPKSELLADALFQAGQAYAKAGQPDVAAERYRSLLDNAAFAAFAYRPEAAVGLGNCLIAEGKPVDAIAVLETVTREHADHASAAEAFFLLGKARYELEAFDAAREAFGQVTARTRGEVAARAQFYTGQAWQAQENFQQALVAYLRVQAIYGAHAEWLAAATFESGKCQEALGAMDEARAAYKAVAKSSKGSTWAKLAEERLAELK